MTVAELIEELKKQPQDWEANVSYAENHGRSHAYFVGDKVVVEIDWAQKMVEVIGYSKIVHVEEVGP